MRIESIKTNKHLVVHLSPAEVGQFGLPSMPVQVEYDSYCRLHDYSNWLNRRAWFEPLIDHLVALADSALEQTTKH